MFIAKNNDLIVLARDTREELLNDLGLMVYTSIEETETEYQLYGGEYLTPEEITQKEAERIAQLHLTRGDVFRGLLLARQVTRQQIRALIEQMPDTTPEEQIAKEYALIDFDESLDFYRGIALLDTLGQALGITEEQMTKFFETKDWHYLISEEVPEVNNDSRD